MREADLTTDAPETVRPFSSVAVGPPLGVAERRTVPGGRLGVVEPLVRLSLAAEVRLYREALSQALASAPGIEVVGTFCNCEELRTGVEVVAGDVVVVDTGMKGWLASARVLTASDVARVVALGVRGMPDEVVMLAEAGVAGYVTREESCDRLVEVVLGVARGEMVCSPEVSWQLMRRVASLASGVRDRPLARLTVRELEIVRLIESGLPNKEIARRLSIQLGTVKNHVRSILEKLEVDNRSEAAAVVRRQG